MKVKEQVVLLGPRKSLVGIIAQPAGSGSAARPAVVILNAGIIHRIGPNRMFVTLSRMLAAQGHTVVRFDLSGIGDSAARTDGVPPIEAGLADIREVLDSLEATRQIRQVLLVGLCSGADQAALYAGTDPRVVGIAQIDPSIPRTRRYYTNHYRGRMFRLSSWLNFSKGRHPLWQKLKQTMSSEPAAEKSTAGPDLQSPEVHAILERAYGGAIAAGVRMLTVCTGGLESQHNYREQLVEAFPKVPFGDRIQLEWFPHTDHTFTSATDRATLLGILTDWSGRQGVAASAQAPVAASTQNHA